MKHNQPIRWPKTNPKILLGGFDIWEYGTRYFHLGPFYFNVEHERGAWVFYCATWHHFSLKMRLR